MHLFFWLDYPTATLPLLPPSTHLPTSYTKPYISATVDNSNQKPLLVTGAVGSRRTFWGQLGAKNCGSDPHKNYITTRVLGVEPRLRLLEGRSIPNSTLKNGSPKGKPDEVDYQNNESDPNKNFRYEPPDIFPKKRVIVVHDSS